MMEILVFQPSEIQILYVVFCLNNLSLGLRKAGPQYLTEHVYRPEKCSQGCYILPDGSITSS